MLRVDQPEWKSIRKEWFLIDILFTFGCDVFVHFQKAHYKSGDKSNTHQILLLCVLHVEEYYRVRFLVLSYFYQHSLYICTKIAVSEYFFLLNYKY